MRDDRGGGRPRPAVKDRDEREGVDKRRNSNFSAGKAKRHEKLVKKRSQSSLFSPDFATEYGRGKRSAKKTEESNKRYEEWARQDTGGHVKASQRAVSDDLDRTTSLRNQIRIDFLKQNKEYKKGTVRVHYKGLRDDEGNTTGNLLDGAKIKRSGWSKFQTVASQFLSKKLQNFYGNNFKMAPHSEGEHGSEIAHVRAQHAGGMTDELGAQPASWHYNVEDMAREEAQAKLAKKFGENVRMKSTTYIHDSGELAGTVKARRHKIYLFNDLKGVWEKKLDHLQDGFRDNINKSEVKALKNSITQLTSDSPNVSLHGANKRDVSNKVALTPQQSFIPRKNNTQDSPYFTDVTQLLPNVDTANNYLQANIPVEKDSNQFKARHTPSSAQAVMERILERAATAIRKKDKN